MELGSLQLDFLHSSTHSQCYHCQIFPSLTRTIPFDKDQTVIGFFWALVVTGLILGLVCQFDNRPSPTTGSQKCKYLWRESPSSRCLIMFLFPYLWYLNKSHWFSTHRSPPPAPSYKSPAALAVSAAELSSPLKTEKSIPTWEMGLVD